jgi:hypothetical protein
MNLLQRWRIPQGRAPLPAVPAKRPVARATALPAPQPAFAPRVSRISNCLKDFLWHLNGIGRGTLLDLGPVWQSTVTFFGERGFKVYTEDILNSLHRFGREQESALLALGPEDERPSRAQLARKFLAGALQYGSRSFDAVLAWDLLDYSDEDLRAQIVDRLSESLRDGGVILAVFHIKHPEQFRRYRVIDETTVELISAPPLAPFGRTFQNREMMDLFGSFHSSKTYLGRDQIREALFVK